MINDGSKEKIEQLKAEIAKLRKEKKITVDDIDVRTKSNWEGNGASLGLCAEQRPEVQRTLRGHFGKVYAMQWAGNDNHVVSASQDGKLIVWNALTTNKVQAIPLRSSWVMTCAYEQFSNNMVACGGLDNTCSIYKLNKDGVGVTRTSKELAAHDGYLSCCRFVNPGEVITSSGDSSCIQWDVERGESKCVFNEHTADVMSVAINPSDPHTFVSGSCDTTAKIWDTRTGKCTITFIGHDSDINSVAYFPDGNAIGSGSDDSRCRLFDVRAFCEVNSFGNDNIVCGITSVAFSKSGRILFAGYDDYTTYGWDVTNKSREFRLSDHENRVSCLGVNTAGDALCTGSWDTLLKVWA